MTHRCDPDPDYRKAAGLNVSHMKLYADGKSLYRAKFAQRKETEALRKGIGLHCIMESGHLDSRFIELPFKDLRTLEAKHWKREQESQGMIVMKREELDTMQRMVENIWRTAPDEVINHLRNPTAMRELSVYRTVKRKRHKGRFDLFVPGKDRNIILDWKSSRTVIPRQLTAHSWDLGYHVQAGQYTRLAELEFKKPCDFMFVFVENSDPYEVVCMNVTRDLIDLGREQYDRAVVRYLEAEKTKVYPGHANGNILELGLPAWVAKENDNVIWTD